MKRKVDIWTSEEGDWVDIFIDGEKLFGGHSFDYGNFSDFCEKFLRWEVENYEFTEYDLYTCDRIPQDVGYHSGRELI